MTRSRVLRRHCPRRILAAHPHAATYGSRFVSGWYTPRVSRLIVNADDLGYTSGINQAIAALHRQHAVSSATAMASGQALPASIAALSPGLSLGAHIVLVDGTPVAQVGPSSNLAPNGAFRGSLSRFAAALLLGRIPATEIEAQAAAQIYALQSRDIAITHVDTHKHTHFFPGVLRPLLRAARSCGVMAVRNPFEPAWARIATPGAPWARRVELLVLERWRQTFLREVGAAGMHTTAGALGVLATGTLNSDVLDRLLHALSRHGAPDDCYELVCHPGIHDDALDAMPTRLRAERQREMDALAAVVPRWTAPGAPHRLISFAEL